MKLRLKDLINQKEESFYINFSENIKLDSEYGFSLSSPVSGRLKIFFSRDNYDTLIIGEIKYILNMTCSRCLEKFNQKFNVWIRAFFIHGKERVKIKEKKLFEKELDTFYYKNNEINLDRLIIDSIIVNVPIKPLCKSECKGLCPVCGKNLNEGQCDCTIDAKVDSPFAKLSNYLGGGLLDNPEEKSIQNKKK